jgi:ATP-dependent Lon protease
MCNCQYYHLSANYTMSDIPNYTPISTASLSDDHEHITSEIQKLETMLHDAVIPHDLWEKANMQLQRINLALKYGGNINQLDMLAKYVEWITSLPWEKQTEDTLDLAKAQGILDKNHFGLEDIKKRMMEYLSVITLQKKQAASGGAGGGVHAPILFFVGLAGTGKTTIASSIAETLGREFVRVPFGGLSSALDLRGLSKVQPEAEPGLIIKALRQVQSRNPVILLDELDRVVDDSRGAIMGVLLELLDPKQNATFVDHYIDFPFDLSQVIFVATANNTQTISTAVLDRLEIIQMPSYTDDQKIKIARDYILPRLIRETGLASTSLNVADGVWKAIARASGFDPGIRSIERKVEAMVRTAAYKTVQGEASEFIVTEANMNEFMPV